MPAPSSPPARPRLRSCTDQPYISLAAPERLLDTRPGASDVLDGNAASYQGIGPDLVDRRCPSPAGAPRPSGVASVFLNVTVVGAANPGYLTVYPCDAASPNASNLNYAAGDTVANAVIAKLDGSGRGVHLRRDAGERDRRRRRLLPDDHVVHAAGGTRSGSSRPGPVAVPPSTASSYVIGRSRDPTITRFPVAGRNSGEIPSSVASVALNVTAIDGGAAVATSPCGRATPLSPTRRTSTSQPGQTIPNLVIAKVSNAGEICIYNYKEVDLAIDVAGYFSTAISYTPLAAPARFMDTRSGGTHRRRRRRRSDGRHPRRRPTSTASPIGGRAGISTSAGAVLANVTVVNPQADGYLSVYPCGQAVPRSRTSTTRAGQTIANSVAAGVGTNKQICIFSSAPTEVLVDVAGTLS